jgi:hypothetical protein
MTPQTKERITEALADDTERWSGHITWLVAHPKEPDREIQLAECEQIIAANEEALAAV